MKKIVIETISMLINLCSHINVACQKGNSGDFRGHGSVKCVWFVKEDNAVSQMQESKAW